MARPRRVHKRQNPILALIALIFIAAYAVIGLSPSFTGFVKEAPAVMAAPTETMPAMETEAEDKEPADMASEPAAVPVPEVITFPGGVAVDYDMKRIALSGISSDNAAKCAASLSVMPELAVVDLTGSELNSEALAAVCSGAPDVRFIYDFDLLGQNVNMRTETLDLTGITHNDVADAANYLSVMKQLKLVDLGSANTSPDLSWEDIGILEAAAPWAKFDYNYILCGKEFSTADGVIKLTHVKMNDEGAAVREVLPYVYSKYLDMDSCGVSNEQMASLRDDFPNTKVVWRIWFGQGGSYTCRTDVTRILATKVSRGGLLTTGNIDNIKYCTDVKYLDVGHNDPLDSVEYVRNMPHLTTAIIAMTAITDISPFEDCPYLEYLEVFSMPYFSDISPLQNCTNLRHLGIQHNPNLTDISPIMSLDLDRLWIGGASSVPYAQVEEYRSKHPYCEIDTTCEGVDMGNWRYTNYDVSTGVYSYVQRYRFLRDQMGYSILLYSFPENDIKYKG